MSDPEMQGVEAMGADGNGGLELTPPDGRTVLLVDDEVDLRDILRLHCELLGFQVVAEASDGDEAIDQAREHQPAFVILDESMPRVRGGEAAPMIRRVAPAAHIVAFSAFLDRKPAWADDFLNKLSISELTPLLGRLLEAEPGY